MQKIAAIHDGGAQGWETLYLAFHLAARLGSPLLVLALPGGQDEPAPSLRSEKIHTGAAAAGIPVEVRRIQMLEEQAVLEEAGELFTLLLPGRLLSEPGRARLLAEMCSCPIWAVAARQEIRRLAALCPPLGQDPAWPYARQLAQRLGLPLLVFSERGDAPGPDGDPDWEALEEITISRVEERVRLREIDVLIFASRDAALFEEASGLLDCIVVLCPPQASAQSP